MREKRVLSDASVSVETDWSNTFHQNSKPVFAIELENALNLKLSFSA